MLINKNHIVWFRFAKFAHMLSLKSKILLFPYWIALKIRHFLYDKGIKKSYSFPIPVICIGNITVGGTGKTPHAEMIIGMLKGKYRIALLSRGYKRKTKGFRIASDTDTFEHIGDEPLQIKHKFPDIIVAVCEDRCEGIGKLLALPEDIRPQLIILDGAFQHRRVKPSHSIVLINWNNPIFSDNLLPLGRLRDLPEQIKRADSVIVTKAPRFGEHDGIIDEELAAVQAAPVEREWRAKLGLGKEQSLCFSSIFYGEPLGVDPKMADNRYIYSGSAVFFTGIANDTQFRDHISGKYKILNSIKFPDHYSFTKTNIKDINNWAALYPTSVVFTTEKDSKRLIGNPYLSEDLKRRLFYIPIEVRIIPGNPIGKQHNPTVQ